MTIIGPGLQAHGRRGRPGLPIRTVLGVPRVLDAESPVHLLTVHGSLSP